MKRTLPRSGFALWKLIGGLALILVGAAILSPMFAHRPREFGHPPSCMNNLKQVSLGVAQYRNDFDENLPLVAVSSRNLYGWGDAIFPYIKNNDVYQCPVQKVDGQNDPRKGGYTDYWFNANLSGVATKKITASEAIITFGDGNYKNDLTDARYSLFALPQTWIADTSSPAYRHNGGANYAFADGHVKMLKPGQANSLFLPR